MKWTDLDSKMAAGGLAVLAICVALVIAFYPEKGGEQLLQKDEKAAAFNVSKKNPPKPMIPLADVVEHRNINWLTYLQESLGAGSEVKSAPFGPPDTSGVVVKSPVANGLLILYKNDLIVCDISMSGGLSRADCLKKLFAINMPDHAADEITAVEQSWQNYAGIDEITLYCNNDKGHDTCTRVIAIIDKSRGKQLGLIH